jgi:hypothetical protein
MKWLSVFTLALALCGCGVSTRVQPNRLMTAFESTSLNSLYVYLSDVATGGVQKWDLPSGILASKTLPADRFGSLRVGPSGEVVVINRFTSSYLTISSSNLERVERQIPLPPSSNPQDVFFLGNDQVYVSYLHETRIDRFDLKTGMPVGHGVDLSVYADADGYPEAAYFFSVGDQVWVSVQRLDVATYEPKNASFLLRIDPQTDQVIQKVTTLFSNPIGENRVFGGSVYVGESKALGLDSPVLDGGIEKFSLTGMHSESMAISEQALGGDLLDFVVLSDSLAMAIIGTPSTHLVLFDPGKGVLMKTIEAGNGYQFSQVLADFERQCVFVTDRSLTAPAIRVFDFEGNEDRKRRIDLVLPAFRIELGP